MGSGGSSGSSKTTVQVPPEVRQLMQNVLPGVSGAWNQFPGGYASFFEPSAFAAPDPTTMAILAQIIGLPTGMPGGFSGPQATALQNFQNLLGQTSATGAFGFTDLTQGALKELIGTPSTTTQTLQMLNLLPTGGGATASQQALAELAGLTGPSATTRNALSMLYGLPVGAGSQASQQAITALTRLMGGLPETGVAEGTITPFLGQAPTTTQALNMLTGLPTGAGGDATEQAMALVRGLIGGDISMGAGPNAGPALPTTGRAVSATGNALQDAVNRLTQPLTSPQEDVALNYLTSSLTAPIGSSPATLEAIKNWQNTALATIQNQMRLAGLGQSGALGEAIGQSESALLAPLYQTEMAQRLTGVQTLLGEGQALEARPAAREQNVANLSGQLANLGFADAQMQLQMATTLSQLGISDITSKQGIATVIANLGNMDIQRRIGAATALQRTGLLDRQQQQQVAQALQQAGLADITSRQGIATTIANLGTMDTETRRATAQALSQAGLGDLTTREGIAQTIANLGNMDVQTRMAVAQGLQQSGLLDVQQQQALVTQMATLGATGVSQQRQALADALEAAQLPQRMGETDYLRRQALMENIANVVTGALAPSTFAPQQTWSQRGSGLLGSLFGGGAK